MRLGLSLLALLTMDGQGPTVTPAEPPASSIPTVAPPVVGATLPSGRNAFYVEGLGSGLIWSVNYDRRTPGDLSVRLGLGFTSTDEGDFFAVPLVVSKLFGTSTTSLEVGLGATYLRAGTVAVGSELSRLWGTGFKEQDAPPVSGLLLSGVVGLRYTVPGAGCILRLTFTPFFAGVRQDLNFSFLPWGGASMGWAFP